MNIYIPGCASEGTPHFFYSVCGSTDPSRRFRPLSPTTCFGGSGRERPAPAGSGRLRPGCRE